MTIPGQRAALGECEGDKSKCNAEGCPLYGTRKRDGRVKDCGDASARSRNNRKVGLAAQRSAARKLKAAGSSSQANNEESWRHEFRWEVKSGKQDAVVVKRWRTRRDQAENVIGDVRPFGMITTHDGETLVTVRLDDFVNWGHNGGAL